MVYWLGWLRGTPILRKPPFHGICRLKKRVLRCFYPLQMQCQSRNCGRSSQGRGWYHWKMGKEQLIIDSHNRTKLFGDIMPSNGPKFWEDHVHLVFVDHLNLPKSKHWFPIVSQKKTDVVLPKKTATSINDMIWIWAEKKRALRGPRAPGFDANKFQPPNERLIYKIPSWALYGSKDLRFFGGSYGYTSWFNLVFLDFLPINSEY